MALINESIFRQAMDRIKQMFVSVDSKSYSKIEIDEKFSIVKQTNEDYVATYSLVRNNENGTSTNVGDLITIPKDMVVSSGTLETCTVANQPVNGFVVGDKYIDLLIANSENQHIYIKVSDLVDLSRYIKKTDYATETEAGILYTSNIYGLQVNQSTGLASVFKATDSDIENEIQNHRPIVPSNIPKVMSNYGIKSKTQILEIAANTTYSTNETQIGTWINGTPIYRIVIDRSSDPMISGNTIDLTSLDIDILIRSDALGDDGKTYGTLNSFVLTAVSGQGGRSMYIARNNETTQLTRSGQYNFFYIILEYTKKSDLPEQASVEEDDS